MAHEEVPEGHRSGFVAVIGRPNVGKSTLINSLLGQSVTAVSPRPQTTRRNQLGILTLADAQMIFIDTPGIHSPRHKLGEVMNAVAVATLSDADLLLVIFDLSQHPMSDDERVASYLRSIDTQAATLVALNKVDLVPPAEMQDRFSEFEALLPEAETLSISAVRGDNLQLLVQRLVALLPAGPRYYPEDQITDTYERDIAADLIRAAALRMLRDEVPHGIAVRIDEYAERDENRAYIRATLFVERESQIGIVVGKKGSMLREIGTLARTEIEAMSGRSIFLETRVKVLPKWRNDERALRQLGYRITKST